MDSPVPPPLQIAVRTKQGTEVLTGSLANIDALRQNPPAFLPSTEDGWICYSKDGSLYAIIEDGAVQIYKSTANPYDDGPLMTIKRANILQVSFSPLGTFLVTWERRVQSKGNDEPNLRIWSVATGDEVRALFQKEYNMEAPPVQWDPEEKIFCFVVSNQINMVDGGTLQQTLPPLRMEGVSMFMIAPSADHIATYVPVKKDAPAKVCIFKYPDVTQVVAAKSFFKASSVQLKWNSTGTALLVLTATELDSNNNSYYGETGLHVVVADGSFQGGISFGNNKGPIQAAEWSPGGGEFLVIQGFQPAKLQLFNAKCTLVADLGSASRNTVVWSPHGRFLAIAGFGNLAGEIDFWDKNKLKKLAGVQDRDAPRTWEWTPDSRCLVTSVLFPKRRVDNGFKLWSYAGELLHHSKVDRLLQVAVRPALPVVYPDRPMSPRHNKKKDAAPSAAPAAAAATAPAKAAYVPPHLRNRGAGASTIMKPVQVEQAPKKFAAVSPEQHAATAHEKNKIRRERRKKLGKGGAKDGEGNAEEEQEEQPEPAKEEDDQQQQDLTRLVKELKLEAVQEAVVETETDMVALDKKLLKLRKKLKELETLGERTLSSVQEEQIAKYRTKPRVEAELAAAEKAKKAAAR